MIKVETGWTAIQHAPNRLMKVLALRGAITAVGVSNHRAPFAPYEVVSPSLNTFPSSSIMSSTLYDLIIYNIMHGEPLLSSLVTAVGEDSMGMPSEGFWTAIEELLGHKVVSPADRQTYWWDEVYKCRIWLKLQLDVANRNSTGRLV